MLTSAEPCTRCTDEMKSTTFRMDAHRAALHSITLYCTQCTAIHCIKLHCTVLHSTLLYWATLHCTIIHRIETNHILWFRSNGKSWGTISNKTALHYVLVYCTALYCTTLQFSTLNCTPLYRTAVFKLRQLLRYFLVTTIGDDPRWTCRCVCMYERCARKYCWGATLSQNPWRAFGF